MAQMPYIDPRLAAQFVEAQRLIDPTWLGRVAAIVRDANDFGLLEAAAVVRDFDRYGAAALVRDLGLDRYGAAAAFGASPSYAEAQPALPERDLPLWLEQAAEPVWRAWLEENL